MSNTINVSVSIDLDRLDRLRAHADEERGRHHSLERALREARQDIAFFASEIARLEAPILGRDPNINKIQQRDERALSRAREDHAHATRRAANLAEQIPAASRRASEAGQLADSCQRYANEYRQMQRSAV